MCVLCVCTYVCMLRNVCMRAIMYGMYACMHAMSVCCVCMSVCAYVCMYVCYVCADVKKYAMSVCIVCTYVRVCYVSLHVMLYMHVMNVRMYVIICVYV